MSAASRSSHPPEWGNHQWFASRFQSSAPEDPSAYFGHRANGYQRFRHNYLVGFLKAKIKSPLHSVLDLGCGTGCLTEQIRRHLRIEDARGADFVKEMVQQAGYRYPRIKFATAALPQLAFPETRFDLIVSSEVLYYLSPDDRTECLRLIEQALSPGGYLLFTARLGAGYFSPAGAERLVRQSFDDLTIAWMHHRLYHALTRPLNRVIALNSALRSDGAMEDRKRGQFLRQHKRLLDNPIVRTGASMASWTGSPLIRSVVLPDLCNRLSAVAKATPSNIIILARKSEDQR
ncbi:MAG: class I SAM-dependent methyltransferase [Candidatus Paceibacterota bacterium]